jgi:hypothetical protein
MTIDLAGMLAGVEGGPRPKQAQTSGYAIQLSASLIAVPLDVTTYYWGGLPVALPVTTGGKAPMYIPKAGRVRRVEVVMYSTTIGTAETSSLSLRVNDTTDYLISAVIKNDVAVERFFNAMLGALLKGGDFIELKWVTPTWTLNPLSVIGTATLYIE